METPIKPRSEVLGGSQGEKRLTPGVSLPLIP